MYFQSNIFIVTNHDILFQFVTIKIFFSNFTNLLGISKKDIYMPAGSSQISGVALPFVNSSTLAASFVVTVVIMKPKKSDLCGFCLPACWYIAQNFSSKWCRRFVLMLCAPNGRAILMHNTNYSLRDVERHNTN